MNNNQSRPAYSILVCPDAMLLREHLDEMLLKLSPGKGSWERRIYWGDELPGEKFWNDLDQQGLFPVNKAIIARRSQEWPAQVWKSLAAALKTFHADVWPIFCLEGNFEKRQPKIPVYIQKNPLYQNADKMGWIWIQQPLAANTLVKYVRQQTDKAGLKLSQQGMEMLCASVLPDAYSIKNEIERLALIASGGELVPEILQAGRASPEADAFNCCRMLLQGNLAAVWQEMRRGDDALLFLLLALLAKEFRLCWQILAGENPYIYPRDADFKKALAHKMGYSRLSDAFALLAEAEWNVKSGRMTPGQSLENLAVAICGLCSTKPGRPFSMESA